MQSSLTSTIASVTPATTSTSSAAIVTTATTGTTAFTTITVATTLRTRGMNAEAPEEDDYIKGTEEISVPLIGEPRDGLGVLWPRCTLI